MEGTLSSEAVWQHLVPVGATTGSDRGCDDLEWPLWASRRMTRKRFRANELRGRMRGQLGPLGIAESRPVAAVESAFDALAAQVPEDATWAAVGRPVAARARDTGWGFNARIQAPNGRSGASGGGRASNPGQPGQLTPEIAL